MSEKPVPVPGVGEVLLEVSRVGICGTDVRIFQGEMRERVAPGRILGHESVGVVRVANAAGVFSLGQRVVIKPTIDCGECDSCRAGLSHVCERLKILGIDEDGALQQFWAIPEHRCHAVPESITDDIAAIVEPLAVAVHAVRITTLRAGDTVGVIGAGTIGWLIALLARKAGVKVSIFEINPHRIEFARQRGFLVVNPKTSVVSPDPNMSVIFECSGSVEGARLMTACAKPRARLILVGIHRRETPTDLYQFFHRELSLQGVRAYSSEDFAEAIRLAAAGELPLDLLISARYTLGEVQRAIETAASNGSMMKVLIDMRV